MGNSEEYWTNLLAIFMHDPPDKALRIANHEGRASKYLKIATGESRSLELRKPSDQEASKIERLPLPKRFAEGLTGDKIDLAVGAESGRITISHPLSGRKIELPDCVLSPEVEDYISAQIEEIIKGEEDPKKIFFLIWRLLPGMLSSNKGYFQHLPAETRAPDHTIWHHCDTAAGFYPTFLDVDKNGGALLSFRLGPVQEFIATARTLRDLWTGSMILSWLTFQAMLPIVEQYGPTALIYPSLRGLPFMDRWLLKDLKIGKEKERLAEEFKSMRMSPCIPNKFLAIVPWGTEGNSAKDIAAQCEKAVKDKWIEMAVAVRNTLGKTLSSLDAGWDSLWNEQVDSFFNIKTSLSPLMDKDALPSAIFEAFGKKSVDEMYENVRLIDKLFEKTGGAAYRQKAGAWQAQVELSARLMDAKRAVTHIPPDTRSDMVPPKCTMMGSYEQMGPAALDESADFWSKAAEKIETSGIRLRRNERLSAISLVKRFAGAGYLSEKLGIRKPKFEDTATVAAAQWLQEEPKLDPEKVEGWSGQWLHCSTQDFREENEEKVPEDIKKLIQNKKDKNGKPPAYYAILMMDADNMGKWLRGDNAPLIKDVYHEKIRDYLESKLKEASIPDTEKEKYLNAKRPLGPAAHMAMSEALTNFAVHVVPEVIKAHDGTLIYAGGDDVLAFLPLMSAVPCAKALYHAFQGKPGFNDGAREGFYRIKNRDMLMMGPTATLSAGIAVAHYKEDLRFALDKARQAEKMAKAAGRDRLAISVLRRSGEHATAVMNWDFAKTFNDWVSAFKGDASDRWVYHLRAELPTLAGTDLPIDLMTSEIKRQLNRSEKETRHKFGEEKDRTAGEKMEEAFLEYSILRKETKAGRTDLNDGALLNDFVILLQSASFFSRGRDR